jgi:raffinose/stachyose/melibiose transport system substrate-binding protein
MSNSVPKVLEIWQAVGREYEKSHPAVKIQFQYLENEDFKAKLPTLLQSENPPSIFHSWGGGVMLEQIQAGFCKDITNAIAGDFEDSFYPAGIARGYRQFPLQPRPGCALQAHPQSLERV